MGKTASAPPTSQTLASFVSRWRDSQAAERANKDLFLAELCDALEVQRPSPTTRDEAKDTYTFELPVEIPLPNGKVTIGRIDLYKASHFILEAKQGAEPDGGKKTTKRGAKVAPLAAAKRGTPRWNLEMDKARGQALGYARSLREPPPFLIVCDIGYCFDLYACFDGTGHYEAFPDPHNSRLFFSDLEKHKELLRAIFTEPKNLDPSLRATKVTRQVAVHLAELAKLLESAGHEPELVAKFLMRCLFTMFAEDVSLLPEHLFTNAIKQRWLPKPETFKGQVESLWNAMNDGSEFFFLGRLLQFNGGLFRDAKALPLDYVGLNLLLEAAECDWADVEPAIFGTLLERALNPRERHNLGAHYTPRVYVERLVRPTIEEWIRADWDIVRAEVRQLVEAGKEDSALKTVRAFHKKLCSLTVLDPACGSGNFLYVTLDLFKRLEGEVLQLLQQLGEAQTLLQIQTVTVTPQQFLGLEKKPWAKEIAELVLWIGYLQWHFRIHGKNLPVPEPVLRDYRNIECRDAVLAYDHEEALIDDQGRPLTRWDGLSYTRNPLTGQEVPDLGKRVPVYRYHTPRPAEWPIADFVVGNPPFVGNKRMRLALGDEYTEALRAAYPEVPEAADLVMYWWSKAATAVRQGKSKRFGLITTNSITQEFNRRVVGSFLRDKVGSLTFAVPNHPWVDTERAADVRIAMTVGSAGEVQGRVLQVMREEAGKDNADGFEVELVERVGQVQADLSVGPDLSSARPLRANAGIAFTGMYPLGQGFVVQRNQVAQATGGSPDEKQQLRPFYIARDLTQTPRNALAIDLYPLSENEVRTTYPHLYEWLLTRVKPERDLNKRPSRRAKWWLFAEPVPALRKALVGLKSQIFVPRTAKFFTFQSMPTAFIPDTSVVTITLDDPFFLGVLSSQVHLAWAMATGGRLGIGDDPRYQHVRTFLPFPFPACSPEQQAQIRNLGAELDRHRKTQQAAHPGLTITGMYNVLEKVRAGASLDARDMAVYQQGLLGTLRKLHDDLNESVFRAYGWPPSLTEEEVLERLVQLNHVRAEEERTGLIRWLRPAFQNPTGQTQAAQVVMAEAEEQTDERPAAIVSTWPKRLPEQIAAVRDLLQRERSTWTLAQVTARFKGARSPAVLGALESLAALGLLVTLPVEPIRWKATASPLP